jgi:hypothetical protein
MMKPTIGNYDKFKQLFEQYSAEAGKKQFLIPYFIAAHPGTSDEDMMNLALWLKRNGFRADQVQAFYPSPMATATTMYHSRINPLKGVHRDGRGETVEVIKGEKRRRLHKAFLRYHDPNNWPVLRDALKAMGRSDLIGNGKRHLIPHHQPLGTGGTGAGGYCSPKRSNSTPVGKAAGVYKKGAAGAGLVRKNGNSAGQNQPKKGQILSQHTGLPPRKQG